MRFNHFHNKGFTFIEILVGMTLLIALIIVVGSISNSFQIVHKVRLKQDAYLLLSEQLEVLRELPYTNLVDIVDEPFEGILYPKGSFTISTDTAQSGNNSISATRHYNGDSTLTALTTPPIGNMASNGTFTAYFRIPSSQPDPWQLGLLFRAQDERNTYTLTMSNSIMTFNKIVNGTTSTLFSSAQSLGKETWHKLELISSGADFTAKLNDILITPSAVTDTEFTTGYIGLGSFSNTNVYFDSISYDSENNLYSWDFDEVDNEIQKEPLGWKRMSPYTFPSVTTAYTISDEEADDSSPLKNITATLSWNDGSDQSLSLETYVSQTGITK